MCAAAITVGLLLFLRVVVEGDLPDDLDDLKWLGIFALVVIVLAVILGSIYAAFTLAPPPRSPGATGARGDGARASSTTRTRSTVASATCSKDSRSRPHIPVPRFAVVVDAAPNSFAVGTRPRKVIVAVTQGAIEQAAATSSRRSSRTR